MISALRWGTAGAGERSSSGCRAVARRRPTHGRSQGPAAAPYEMRCYSTVAVNCEFAEPTPRRTKIILPESCWVSMIVRNRKPGPPESDSCVPPLPDSKLAIVPANKAPRLTRSRGASPADHRSHGLRQLCAEQAIRPVSSEQQHATRFGVPQAAPRRSTGPRHCVTLRGGC